MSLENVTKFKYLGTKLTDQTFMKIKSRLVSEMLATIRSRVFCLLSSNVKAKIYRTVILPVVSYGCELGFSH
jgi:hypothetical protein